MKTTKEQRAELRARVPTSPQSMYQLYVRRDELHSLLVDLDEALTDLAKERERAEKAERECKTQDTNLGDAQRSMNVLRAAQKTDKIDPRPKCIKCGKRWVPAEGIDATCRPCDVCWLNEPGTSSPDDAERAAREWWAENVNGVAADFDEHPETAQALARLLRTRDAQAREAGWNEAVDAFAEQVRACAQAREAGWNEAALSAPSSAPTGRKGEDKT